MIPAEEKEDYRILATKQTNLACLTQIGIHWNDGRHAACFCPAGAPLPRHMPDIGDSPALTWTIPAIILDECEVWGYGLYAWEHRGLVSS